MNMHILVISGKKTYEYLRTIEYRLAIPSGDKYDYLGEAYCTEEEIKLAAPCNFHH